MCILYMCLYVCTCVCMYTVCVCMCILYMCLYVCICVYSCVYMYLYVCVHTCTVCVFVPILCVFTCELNACESFVHVSSQFAVVSGPKLIPCSEDNELLAALDKMMSDSAQVG